MLLRMIPQTVTRTMHVCIFKNFHDYVTALKIIHSFRDKNKKELEEKCRVLVRL
jgi:hypothetical protein